MDHISNNTTTVRYRWIHMLIIITYVCLFIIPVINKFCISKYIFLMCSIGVYFVLFRHRITISDIFVFFIMMVISVLTKSVNIFSWIPTLLLYRLIKTGEGKTIKTIIEKTRMNYVSLFFVGIYSFVYGYLELNADLQLAHTAIKETNESGLCIFLLGMIIRKKYKSIGNITLIWGLFTLSRNYILALLIMMVCSSEWIKRFFSWLYKHNVLKFLYLMISVSILMLGLAIIFNQFAVQGEIGYNVGVSRLFSIKDISNLNRFNVNYIVVQMIIRNPVYIFTGIPDLTEYKNNAFQIAGELHLNYVGNTPHNFLFDYFRLYGVLSVVIIILIGKIVDMIINKQNIGVYLCVCSYALILSAGFNLYFLYLTVFALLVYANNKERITIQKRGMLMKGFLKRDLHIIGDYLLLYTVIVAIAVILLLIGCFLPQKVIDRRIQESVPVFESERSYPCIGDKKESSRLDNFTDALILMESATMRSTALHSIFSNPMYFNSDPAADFTGFLERRDNTQPTGYYVRYWMGFRTPVRLALTFMNYSQIRSVLAWIILGLLVIVAFYTAHYTDIRSGLLFAASIIFIKPQVLCNSLQYSCCFILAMISMFFIPLIISKGKEINYFFALGMITMYFDFYTSPLVVLGYPLIFMILLKTDKKPVIKLSLSSMFCWGIGYGVMWLTKLLFATFFTDINGFSDGFRSFAMRVGIHKRMDYIDCYSIKRVFNELKGIILPDTLSKILVFILLLVMFSIAIICAVRDNHRYKQCINYITLLFPVIALIIWYIIAAQPTVIHIFFQYRNISMAIWGGSMFYSIFLYPINKLTK